jgi:hypothetical protein
MAGEFYTCQLLVVMATRVTVVSRQDAKVAKEESELSIQYFMRILKNQAFPLCVLGGFA